ncbi:macrophage mannose receptor 1-like isoform X2 [Pectinophora gossypiella]|uniref:macrophage mannose receptor 1-like isoform X2 n=1 Tax=Pectinophora gossypiella TaxID=13191 RepID=UPI00214E84A8|nr:macrophage mannose receptor 1-like isoform X2 [Pectinophora gossypiella]
MFYILVLCVLSYNSVTECMANGEFRSDYTYYNKAGGWLKLHMVPANWHDARLRCQLEGAVLASPLNPELKSSMIDIMGKFDPVYTGIHSTFSKGDFFSIEGVPLSAIPAVWKHYYVDSYADDEGCIIMRGNEHMGDFKCSNVNYFICYKRADNKTITQNECGTTDSEYKLSTVTGSCYKFHRTPRTWSRAYMACAAEGGHLAIINSQAEATVLSGIFRSVPANDLTKIVGGTVTVAHIGFHDWGEHGDWLTIHGQTLKEAGYNSWSPGEPNNVTTAQTGWVGEYCGSIYTSGLLNDIWCDYAVGFICEKDPSSLAVKFQQDN